MLLYVPTDLELTYPELYWSNQFNNIIKEAHITVS